MTTEDTKFTKLLFARKRFNPPWCPLCPWWWKFPP